MLYENILSRFFPKNFVKATFLSTSIYDLVLLDVCHFHHHVALIRITSLPNFSYFQSIYRDTRLMIKYWILHPRILLKKWFHEIFWAWSRFHSVLWKFANFTFTLKKIRETIFQFLTTKSAWWSGYWIDFSSICFRRATRLRNQK